MDFNLENIGRELKARRLSAGITQADLGHRANISRATINALENNSIKEIGVRRLSRLFEVLDHVHRKEIIPKSKVLELSFPYDWSNPEISDEALIINVLQRGIFEDIAIICAHYGVDRVSDAAKELTPESTLATISLNRMLTNISKGFSHVNDLYAPKPKGV